VKNSFAKYVEKKGYHTAAFYPLEGSFYNADKAFNPMGSGSLLTAALPEDWGSLIDRDIIKAVIEQGASKSSGPFFYYIGTSENHGPHPCRSF
jgi:phosphoglycerol transferase MdoB-like AlkP superfamily enzyme